MKKALEILSKQVTTNKVTELSARAIELQDTGNYPEAITTYLAAISINPNDASLYYNLGTAYQASGNLQEASTQYNKALEIDKENETYKGAVNSVKIALATPLIQSAVSKQTANDIQGAISDYTKALEYTPGDAQTYFNLATAYQADKQIDKAVESYLKAIELDPKGQADAFFFLGTLYEEKKNNKFAIDNYQKYIQNAPSGSYIRDAEDRIAYLKTLKQ